MKTIKNLAFYAILITMIGLVGCQKDFIDDEVSYEKQTEQTKQKPEVKVIDGVLHFRDVEAFMKITEKLGVMSEKQKDIWEEKLGFISLRKSIKKANDLMENVKSLEELNSILLINNDIIYENNNVIMSRVISGFYQIISNRRGMYIIDGVLYRVVDKNIYISLDGNFEKIETVNNNKAIPEGIINYNYTKEVKEITYCTNAYGDYESPDDRMIKAWIFTIRVIAYHPIYPTTYQWVEVERKSKSYIHTWGKWRLHKAHHHRKEISYTVIAPHSKNDDGSVNYLGYNGSFPNNHYGGYVKSFSEWQNHGNVIEFNEGWFIRFPYFWLEDVTGKFNTTGYYGVEHWITIRC